MALQTTAALQKSEINVEELCLVAPAQATDDQPLYLSNYDQQVLFNLESVYFYPPSPHRSDENVVDVLRAALSKLLVPYHFMAGRLRMNAREKRVEVDCNRAGALFVAATTNVTLADLQDGPTLVSLLKDFILHSPASHQVSDAPLLTLQVTKFKCGGFVVGISRNHALVGGTSGDDFLANLTAAARGQEFPVKPVADRRLLRARDLPNPSYEHFEYMKVDQVPQDSYFTTPNSLSQLKLNGNFGAHFGLWKTFNFPTEVLNSLKARALADGLLSRCTTFEALATKVWQARTQALSMDPDQTSNLVFVVDSRKVLTPSLPVGFTGNTLSLACARMPPRDLAEKPFSACVEEVQVAKARITDGYVRSAIDWLELNHAVPAVNSGIYLSSWANFSFHKVDFGWGPPSHTIFIPGERGNNCVIFLPSKQGLDVCLALEPHQASAFQNCTGSILKWPPPPRSRAESYATQQRAGTGNQARYYSTSSNIIGALRKNLKRWRI
ncbi:BAHD family acyltransferase, clade V [Selaginella moellendorffii]|uniref:BAHD family acyltransferase, clade V n=1 Tax=Selaginella moellendorffii TaxID=88036 RepID=D8SFR4_SELML|nr:omega-hydroxypalmitate O-feruloyl transferase [Selaginella moellendorffii]EFJ16772.1 BAHD family acyltransferase, clade V [Selaginella moellendorffii]|eukprot:XP_002982104.1 omega-hydroxypalmitate O-feruloyl transferase [Selaginella moellendorffii]